MISDEQILPLMGAATSFLIGVLVFAIISQFAIFTGTPVNTVFLGAVLGFIYVWVCAVVTECSWDTAGSIFFGIAAFLAVIVGAFCGSRPPAFSFFLFGGGYATLIICQFSGKLSWKGHLLCIVFYVLLGLIAGMTFRPVYYFRMKDWRYAVRNYSWNSQISKQRTIRPVPPPLWKEGLLGTVLGILPIVNVLWIAIVFPGMMVAEEEYTEFGVANISWLSMPFFVIPLLTFLGYGLVRLSTVETLLRGWFHITSPSKEEILAQMEAKMQQEIKERKRKIDEERRKKEAELDEILTLYPDIVDKVTNKVPQILQYFGGDLGYKGFREEVRTRFQIDQVAKTLESKSNALQQAIQLAEDIAGLAKAQADLDRAFHEVDLEMMRIAVEKARMADIEKQTELEIDIKTLQLEKEKTELEEGIENVRVQKEVERAQLQAEIKSLKGEKPVSREEEEKRLQEEALRKIAKSIAIEMAQIEGAFKRAAFYVQQEKKIREEHPEVADEIIDLVDRMMTEEEIE